MRIEHGQSKLICQMCETRFFSRDGMNRHIKKVHRGEDDARKWELSEKGDNATSNLGNVEVISCTNLAEFDHAKYNALENVVCTDEGKSGSIAGARVKAVECDFKECEKMFYSQRDMGDHMRKRHGAEKLSCPRLSCEAEFGSLWGLKRHIKAGHEKKNLELAANQPVQQVKKRADIGCKVEGCLKKFLPYNINQRKEDHMRKEHGQSKLICQLCEASYFSREGLNQHMKKAHKGENDATERKLGDKKEASNVGNVSGMSPIAVQEPEVEVLDMEIF